MNIFDRIDEPTMLLDTTRARANLARMAAHARQMGVRFRPHFKTHQSQIIGEWFRQEGVQAITVSSVGMAEYFASAGWRDILIAFPVNLRQIARIQRLAEQVHLGLLVESSESVAFLTEHLTAPVDVWIKIDTGSGRTGLPWDQVELVCQLALQIHRATPILNLRGLLTHAGNTYQAGSVEKICEITRTVNNRLVILQKAVKDNTQLALEISTGDTPGCSRCDDYGGVDENRPGNFIFYDATQWKIGSCAEEDVAVCVACPVVALHPERNEVIVYGGAVHLSKDFYMYGGQRSYGAVALPDGRGWGTVLPGVYVRGLSQEHGILHVPPEQFDKIKVGELVCILPAHSCLTIDLLREYVTLEGMLISVRDD